jgi:hypothetical protein
MSRFTLACLLSGAVLVAACAGLTKGVPTDPAVTAQQGQSFSDETDAYMKQLFDEGKKIFRTTRSALKHSGAISFIFISPSSAKNKAASGRASARAMR